MKIVLASPSISQFFSDCLMAAPSQGGEGDPERRFAEFLRGKTWGFNHHWYVLMVIYGGLTWLNMIWFNHLSMGICWRFRCFQRFTHQNNGCILGKWSLLDDDYHFTDILWGLKLGCNLVLSTKWYLTWKIRWNPPLAVYAKGISISCGCSLKQTSSVGAFQWRIPKNAPCGSSCPFPRWKCQKWFHMVSSPYSPYFDIFCRIKSSFGMFWISFIDSITQLWTRSIFGSSQWFLAVYGYFLIFSVYSNK